MERKYLCIDLKSFYASVECVERGLDPMTAKLVVADPERTDKTICLAVTPALKALGVKNRCRIFEIPKNISYTVAPPRMRKYIDYAAEIYGVYLRYISPEDIHVYSVDEAFFDVTRYLERMGMTARELAVMLMDEVFKATGVRATCGIGTNLYLAKIALDITAKRAADFIGELDETEYRRTLWNHRPLTDFWRIGAGTAERLAQRGIFTMRQITEADENSLYRIFGVDAELLIDHAWGRESVTIADIKAYRPRSSSITSGQVLMRDYSFDECRVVVREMIDSMCFDLMDRGLTAQNVSVAVGYSNALHLPMANGSSRLCEPTSSSTVLTEAVTALYEKIADRRFPIRRVHITCANLSAESEYVQESLFDAETAQEEKNRKMRRAMLEVKKKYGKNAVLLGRDFDDAATARERNRQIGGHKSGE